MLDITKLLNGMSRVFNNALLHYYHLLDPEKSPKILLFSIENLIYNEHDNVSQYISRLNSEKLYDIIYIKLKKIESYIKSNMLTNNILNDDFFSEFRKFYKISLLEINNQLVEVLDE